MLQVIKVFFRFYVSYVIPEIIQGNISGEICRNQQLCAMVNDKLQPSDINSAQSSSVERNLGLCKYLYIVITYM